MVLAQVQPGVLLHLLSMDGACSAGSLALLQGVQKVGIANYLVVAIDAELRDYLTKQGHNVYYRDITVRVLAANFA